MTYPTAATPSATTPTAGARPLGLAAPAAPEYQAPKAPAYQAPDVASPSAPHISVRGTAQGGPQGAFVLTGDDIDYVRCPPRLATAQGTYALFIEGDSMTPRYEPGELIFVSPRRPARIGDDVVIIRRDGAGEQCASIKRLLKRGGEEVVAEQFNPPIEIRFAATDIEAIHLVLRMVDLYGY